MLYGVIPKSMKALVLYQLSIHRVVDSVIRVLIKWCEAFVTNHLPAHISSGMANPLQNKSTQKSPTGNWFHKKVLKHFTGSFSINFMICHFWWGAWRFSHFFNRSVERTVSCLDHFTTTPQSHEVLVFVSDETNNFMVAGL